MVEKRIKDLKKGAFFYKRVYRNRVSLLCVLDGYNRKTKLYEYHYYYNNRYVGELSGDSIVYAKL